MKYSTTISRKTRKLKILNVIKDQVEIIREFPLSHKAYCRPYSVSVPQKIPILVLPKMKAEWKMEGLEVISKVNEPIDWCVMMLLVPKPTEGVKIYVDLMKKYNMWSGNATHLPNLSSSRRGQSIFKTQFEVWRTEIFRLKRKHLRWLGLANS